MFPPGRARLLTRPDAAGSLNTTKTTGIVRVACFAARIAAVPETTMRSTLACTSSRDERRKPLGVAPRPSIFDAHVLALDPAEVAQAAAEHRQLRVRRVGAAVGEIADPPPCPTGCASTTSGVPPRRATPSAPTQPSSIHHRSPCLSSLLPRPDGRIITASAKWQAAQCPSATARSAGVSWMQRCWRSRQRGANEQPVCGTASSVPVPGAPRLRRAPSAPGRGAAQGRSARRPSAPACTDAPRRGTAPRASPARRSGRRTAPRPRRTGGRRPRCRG